MCTDVYRCVQEKIGAAIKEFFDVYKMCTDVYKDVYMVCTGCVQSLVHLSMDPNFCNGYIRSDYICAGRRQRRRRRATSTSVNGSTDLCSPPAAVFDVYKMCTDVYEKKWRRH